MSDTSNPSSQSLGIGKIFGDSFTLVFQNFMPMIIIGAIPSGVGVILSLLIYGTSSQNMVLAITDPEAYIAATAGVSTLVQFIISIVGLLLMGLAMASVTAAAYTAIDGRQISVSTALSRGMGSLFPVLICMIFGGIAVYLGFLALIVPGLYLAALWFVIIPAIVVESAGFGSFGRSSRLTKDYRWPLVGLVILFALITLLISVASGALTYAAFLMGSVGIVFSIAISVVVGAFFYAISGALAALAYARLVEIKEGTSMRTLADVFS